MKKSIEYLPEYLRENEFFRLVCDCVDWLFDEELLVEESLPSSKWNLDIQDIETLNSLSEELGLDYITSVLLLTKETLKSLLEHAFLLRYLKGSRAGLERVLELLGIAYTVTEWWEKSPPGDEFTFDLEVDLNLSQVKPDTVGKLLTFLRSYVYPLVNLVVKWCADFAELDAAFLGGEVSEERGAVGGINLFVQGFGGERVEQRLSFYLRLPSNIPIYLTQALLHGFRLEETGLGVCTFHTNTEINGEVRCVEYGEFQLRV